MPGCTIRDCAGDRTNLCARHRAVSHLRVRSDDSTKGCPRQQHLHPSFPQVLRFEGELCDITWGLRQEGLRGIELRWRGRLAKRRPVNSSPYDRGRGVNNWPELSRRRSAAKPAGALRGGRWMAIGGRTPASRCPVPKNVQGFRSRGRHVTPGSVGWSNRAATLLNGSASKGSRWICRVSGLRRDWAPRRGLAMSQR